MNNYTLTRQIPSSRLPAYLSLGWSVQYEARDGVTVVGRTIQTKMGEAADECNITHPYLIQCASIRRPLGLYTNATLSGSLNMEYMGEAEFEYGALPRSFRRIETQWSLYQCSVAKSIVATINGKDFPLNIYANFDTAEQEAEYLKLLLSAFAGTHSTKESLFTTVKNDRVLLNGKIDFWWDIRNDIFFSFDKQFMKRLNNNLQATFRVLNT